MNAISPILAIVLVGVYVAPSRAADVSLKDAATQRTSSTTTAATAPAGMIPGGGGGGTSPMSLSVDPKKLVVCGATRGAVDLSVQFRSPQAGTVSIGTPQLTTADGCGHLAVSAVTVGNGAKDAKLDANVPTALPVRVDTTGAASGEYSGEILFQPQAGGSPVSVPITVRLKDAPWWAMIVLLVGVAMSYALSYYREVGRRRDLLILRAARLQDLLTNDAEVRQFSAFADALGAKLDGLSDRLARTPPDFAGAETIATEGDAVAALWFAWRDRWARARHRLDALRAAAAGNPAAAAALRAADGAVAGAAGAANPVALEAAIDALAIALNPAGGSAPAAVLAMLPNVHFAPRRITAAQFRERAFEYLAAAVALTLLYFVGYRELYAGNPTFGAKGLVDYGSLFVWGFGAEATRASLVAVIRNWGIHGFA